jgi:hypothetical protein
MLDIRRKMLIGMALSAMLLVGACTATEPAEPTPDLNVIKTEAVQTAMVEMTVQAALLPTKTDVPATMTPLPTATLDSDAAQPAGSSSSSSGSSSGGSDGTSGTPIATWTPDVYRCEFVTQTPLDGPQVTGANYDVVWTVRNVGAAVWDKDDYYLKWMGGDDLSPSHIYKLKHDVGYWETIELTVDIQLPTSPRLKDDGLAYTTWWSIVNDNGEAFCNVDHYVSLTFTPTPKPSATP